MQIDVSDGMSRNIISDDERIDEINENLRLIQKKNGLVFGTDAYLLSAYVKGKRNAVAADLGSGTGVAAFLLAVKEKAQTVHAYEIQETFATLIDRNTALNGLDGRIVTHHTDVREAGIGDIGAECDIVICNPPYMKRASAIVNDNDTLSVSRHEILCTLEDVIKTSAELLISKGRLYMVHRPSRLADIICLMREYKIEPKCIRMVAPNSKKEPNLLLIEGMYCGGRELRFMNQLCVFDENGSYSDEINKIYGRS